MTIKKLSAEGRFEAGIDENFAGKLFAFVAIVGKGPYTLGIAEANVAGYTPVPATWCYGDDYAEMSAHADELNIALELTEAQAVRVVASSMAQGKVKKENA